MTWMPLSHVTLEAAASTLKRKLVFPDASKDGVTGSVTTTRRRVPGTQLGWRWWGVPPTFWTLHDVYIKTPKICSFLKLDCWIQRGKLRQGFPSSNTCQTWKCLKCIKNIWVHRFSVQHCAFKYRKLTYTVASINVTSISLISYYAFSVSLSSH